MTFKQTSQPTLYQCVEDCVYFELTPASDGTTMHPHAVEFLRQQAEGTLICEPYGLPQIKARVLGNLAARRWQIETGGTTVAGIALATDDRTKLLLQGAAQAAQNNPAFTTRWKTPAGWVQLDASAVSACYSAVFEHVENCFARESELAAQIDACTTQEQLQVVEQAIQTFWP